MPSITLEGQHYDLNDGENLLAGLERHGVAVPSSCRAGVCQSCLMKAVDGPVPESAQRGLLPTLRAQGYLLACSCVPAGDLALERPGDTQRTFAVAVVKVERLGERIVALHLTRPEGFDYRPGQFINLRRGPEVIRSYSLASHPALDATLTLHIAHLPGGALSEWACTQACPGDTLELSGPLGHCFYVPGAPTQPLFLLGTGTGLAPLYGILRDALAHGHTGAIHLFHGALRDEQLYLHEALRALAAEHGQFQYHPAALEGGQRPGVHGGDLAQHALATCPDLTGHRVYLCGHPDLVKAMQKKTFLAGASMNDILADAFLPAVK